MSHNWQKVKLGEYVSVYKIDIHNIKIQNANNHHMDIHYKDYEIYSLVVVHKQKNKTPHQNIKHNHKQYINIMQ